MRDCIFLLADAEMKAAFEGFFSRHNFHLSLGTAPFEVDLRKDIIHDAQGKDPGIYTRGWREDRFAVIVINPELEAWIWQDNVHVEKALGYTSPPSLRLWLRDEGLWPDGLEKPPDPKEAVLRTMLSQKKFFSGV